MLKIGLTKGNLVKSLARRTVLAQRWTTEFAADRIELSEGVHVAGASTIVSRLYELRATFTPAATAEKAALLEAVSNLQVATPSGLKRLHATLCYLRAFPDSATTYRRACDMLDAFAGRVASIPAKRRRSLDDTGIAGTAIHYTYSLEVARWLTRTQPTRVRIDWDAFEATHTLDDILSLLLAPAEDQAFSEGEYTTREWLDLARSESNGTDFDWLIREMNSEPRLRATAHDLYERAELPVRWRLESGAASISRNRVDSTRATIRTAMRRPPDSPMRWIARPMTGIRRLSPSEGRRVIDVAIAALATRHREVYSMSQGNPAEVWLAPLGEGAQLAVMGVRPEARPVLESNYGYVLLSNGVPIGYGGVSPLFDQGNTGINIFEEYRRSEAAFLFAQTLRAFHTLFGCRHFIANPYQFGEGNAEAIGSGAFWFYYRLGFRPADSAIRAIAEREYATIERLREHRSDAKTLRALAKADLILTLPGSRSASVFSERWLLTISEGATRLIARRGGSSRRAAVRSVVREVAAKLGVGNMSRWSRPERDGFERLAPYAALCDELVTWPLEEKRRLVALMRAKTAGDGRDYSRLLQRHTKFKAALVRYCRNVERG